MKKVKELEKTCTSEAVGAAGLVWAKVKSLKPGSVEIDSSAKKFFDADALKGWADACGAAEGDLVCCFWGPRLKTQTAAGKFRHLLGSELGLRDKGWSALWVVDFPLLEYDEDAGRFIAMHHPFTSCKPDVSARLRRERPGRRAAEQLEARLTRAPPASHPTLPRASRTWACSSASRARCAPTRTTW